MAPLTAHRGRFLTISMLAITGYTVLVTAIILSEVRSQLILRQSRQAGPMALDVMDRLSAHGEPFGGAAPAPPVVARELGVVAGRFGLSGIHLYRPDGSAWIHYGQPDLGLESEFSMALEGNMVSRWIDDDRGAVVRIFVPITRQDGAVLGVVRLDRDGRDIEEDLGTITWRVAALSAGALLVLLLVLLLFLRQSDAVIAATTRELIAANERLADLSSELEDRVIATSHQLVRADKLAVLGRIAAGVAHEVNTPIASISTCAEGLLKRLRADGMAGGELLPMCEDYLGTIRDESFRVKEITGTLLSLARSEVQERQAIDLQETIERVYRLLEHRAKERNIRLELEVSGEIGSVRSVGDGIVGVVLNLTQNALDACADSGLVRWSLSRDGERMVARVEDDGAGIPPDLHERIWEPFFTTKDPGRGTGLGLAICHSFVMAVGGEIQLDSEPGEGTRVTLRLPLAIS